jgi:hypothetical protein
MGKWETQNCACPLQGHLSTGGQHTQFHQYDWEMGSILTAGFPLPALNIFETVIAYGFVVDQLRNIMKNLRKCAP